MRREVITSVTLVTPRLETLGHTTWRKHAPSGNETNSGMGIARTEAYHLGHATRDTTPHGLEVHATRRQPYRAYSACHSWIRRLMALQSATLVDTTGPVSKTTCCVLARRVEGVSLSREQ